MNVVAFDLGLTVTGICLPSGTTEAFRPRGKGVERLDDLFSHVTAICKGYLTGPRLVVVEGYSYGSTQGGPTAGELGGVLRLAVHRANCPLLVVAPTSVKKYATGKGNAPKAAVVSAATQRADRSFSRDDEADAWWLWAFAHDLHGEPVVDMPKSHRVALEAYREAT